MDDLRHPQIAEPRDHGLRRAVVGKAWDWLSGVR
jgi:hypothetical protein